MNDPNEAWKSPALVNRYLTGLRSAIPLAAEQIDVMMRIVDATARDATSIADLGCGDGILAATLLKRYPHARATLVDFSEPMIAAARNELAPYGDACEFHLADLSSAEWVDAAGRRAPFDVVVSGYAIHHTTDERKRVLYREIFELLRPGGVFVNIEHVKSPTERLRELSDDLIIDSVYPYHLKQDPTRTREDVADEFVHREDKHGNILALVEDQCHWLREIGFVDVDCYFKILELAVFGGRKSAN
jgi:SAM-dependent methyltransferase